MVFDVLTLFPGMFESYLGESILGKAVAAGLVTARMHNIRDYAMDKHKMADDRPFGGGEGMVMKPEPIVQAIEDILPDGPPARVILLTPQGRVLDQELVRELSGYPRLMLVCGRYEGVDERVSSAFVDEEISLGDFVLTGGELAAMAVMDAVARLVPGVLGNSASPYAESFASGSGGAVLEYPQYTRPREFRGMSAPDILFSGDHGAIRRWRRGQALLRTLRRRPDLFARLELGDEDRALLREAQREELGGQTG